MPSPTPERLGPRIQVVLDLYEVSAQVPLFRERCVEAWEAGGHPESRKLDAFIRHVKPEVDAGHGPHLHPEIRLLLDLWGVDYTSMVEAQAKARRRHKRTG